MASQEAAGTTASNKLKVGRTTEYRRGANTELLTIGGGGGGGDATKLYLLCGGGGADRFEPVRPFRTGEFSVHMIRVRGRPISMLTCTVDDHQWMLAKDAFAGRIEARVFVFGLPGFCYGLELPSTADGLEEKLRMLEEIFARFSAYRDLTAEDGSGPGGNGETELDNPWARAYPEIEKQLATWQIPPAAAAAAAAAKCTEEPSAAELVQRAVRSSAAVKLLARSLLAGALHPAEHLLLHGGGGAGAAAALPTMSVVAGLLTAIETGRIPEAAGGAIARPEAGGGRRWCVNGDGVALLWRVMRVARADGAAAAGSRGRGRGRGRGGGARMRVRREAAEAD